MLNITNSELAGKWTPKDIVSMEGISFQIEDYEDGRISFFCRELEVVDFQKIVATPLVYPQKLIR